MAGNLKIVAEVLARSLFRSTSGSEGVVVVEDSEVGTSFRPYVVRFRWMHAGGAVLVISGERNLRGIWAAWRDQTVDIGRSGVAQYLLRTGTVRLREVVVLHCDDKDRLNLL